LQAVALAKATATCVPKYGDGVHNFTAISCTGLSPHVVQLIYVLFQKEENKLCEEGEEEVEGE